MATDCLDVNFAPLSSVGLIVLLKVTGWIGTPTRPSSHLLPLQVHHPLSGEVSVRFHASCCAPRLNVCWWWMVMHTGPVHPCLCAGLALHCGLLLLSISQPMKADQPGFVRRSWEETLTCEKWSDVLKALQRKVLEKQRRHHEIQDKWLDFSRQGSRRWSPNVWDPGLTL